LNKPVFYIILFLCTWGARAQENLVPNGSFEEFTSCPVLLGDFNCTDWFVTTLGSADHYNVCSIDAGVPQSTNGYQDPIEGDSYIALVLYDSISVYREYVSVILTNELVNNELYEFSMYVSLADSTMRASNKFGVYFSESSILDLTTYGVLNYVPQINFDTLITDNVNWIHLSCYYLAIGNEKVLTLGSFNNDLETNAIKVSNDYNLPSYGSYYFFDNVSLIQSEITIPNVFTPNRDGSNDYLEISNLPKNTKITVVNRWGEIVFQSNNAEFDFWDGKKGNTNLNEGTYFYHLVFGQVKKTGFIQLIR
jgi:gliding motility-associated-like protein